MTGVALDPALRPTTGPEGSARPRMPVRWFVPAVPVAEERHPVPHRAPTLLATVNVVGSCIGWGIGIGFAAGAAAGTILVPLLGTVYGGLVGGIVAVAPLVPATVVIVAVLLVRHRPAADPNAVLVDISRCFVVLVVALLLVAGWLVAQHGTVDLPWWWFSGIVAAAAATVVLLLRPAAMSIARAWCRVWGWT